MFKIGDKVKPKDPKWKYGVGEIIGKVSNSYIVQYNTSACVTCNNTTCSIPTSKKWHRSNNIEYAVRKNQQLEFNFMR